MARYHALIASVLLLGGLVLHGTADAALFSKEQSADDQRAEIRKVRDQTLATIEEPVLEGMSGLGRSRAYSVRYWNDDLSRGTVRPIFTRQSHAAVARSLSD